MKLFKNTLIFGGLLALATTLSAETALVNVNVPFSFVAGSKVMPAGTYTIEENSTRGILLIRGNQPNSTALVIAVNAGQSTSNQAAVTFSRSGSSVVLSTVNVPGGSKYSLVAQPSSNAAAINVALPRK